MIGMLSSTRRALFSGASRNLGRLELVLPCSSHAASLVNWPMHKCTKTMQTGGVMTSRRLFSASAKSPLLETLLELNRDRKNRDLLAHWDKQVKATPAGGLDGLDDDALAVYLAALHRARDARFDEWHSVLEQQQTGRSYNLLVAVYCYRDFSSRVRMVLEAWAKHVQEIQQAGKSPADLGLSLIGCQGVLGWLARRGLWREASLFVSTMAKGQATADDFEGTMFVDIPKLEHGNGEVAHAVSYMRTLLTSTQLPAPDQSCYRRAIRSCMHAGQITSALDLFSAMIDRGIKPNPATAGTMLLTYKSKDVDPRYLLVFHAAITDQLATAEGVHFEKHHMDVLKAYGLTIDEMKSDLFTGRCAVALAQRGFIQQAFELTDRLDITSTRLVKIAYSSMLKTLIDMRMWSKAYDVFKRLRDSGIRLDAALHEQVARVLAENKRWHLLSEITKSQVPKERLAKEIGNR